MHKLLRRQLKRHLPKDIDNAQLDSLWQAINGAYSDFDNERSLLERSLDLVSDELNERNLELRTQLKQLESTHVQLGETVSVLDSIFNATGEAILAFNYDGCLLQFNQTAQDLLQLESDKAVYGNQHVMMLFSRMLQDNRAFFKDLKTLQREPAANLFGTVELRDHRLFEYHSSPQWNKNQLVGRVWCFRNVTKIKENEALVQYQAFHDALTGLPNRILLLDRINHAIKLTNRKNDYLAILFIDLDHFKKVNDTEGHQVGDELLVEVSGRIQECLRDYDTLARFGGDEFVVLLESIDSHEVAARTSKRIIKSLSNAFAVGDKRFHISASIGVSMYPRDDDNPQELIRKADLAMYHAKQNGRSQFEFFDAPLERLAHYQLELENKLRTAISKNELTIYYQPQVKCSDLKIDRIEALLRWFPINGSPISPGEFIPVAERAGLICEIGYWVLEQCCQQIKSWHDQGLENICIAINLSAQQIAEPDFVSQVKLLLEKYDIPGPCLEFEITESILVEDLEKVTALLYKLRKLEISLAIDDFGTGYSSLQYLQQLPIDMLKIDRSFVQDLLINPNNQSIVNAIISLGHNLNLKVVAEGVEDSEVVDFLRSRECEYIQGFYFYKPMPSNEVSDVLVQSKKPIYTSS